MAQHVREFSRNVADTHQQATDTIGRMSEGYQGASYDALVQKWADKSNAHMTELHDACEVVATALDAGADFIVAQKVAAIAELIAMAAAFVARTTPRGASPVRPTSTAASCAMSTTWCAASTAQDRPLIWSATRSAESWSAARIPAT